MLANSAVGVEGRPHCGAGDLRVAPSQRVQGMHPEQAADPNETPPADNGYNARCDYKRTE